VQTVSAPDKGIAVKAAMSAADPPARKAPAMSRNESTLLFSDIDTENEPNTASPTAHLLDELALHGHRAGQDESDPRPLPEPDAVRGQLDAMVEAFSAMLTGTRLEDDLADLLWSFCDLVGSTELSSRLDPEDLREVIVAYHRGVAGIVAGFDGFVAKYMGDGVLVYFGYPRAHEDDAERAVRAGLGVIDAVGRLDVKSVKLRARAGIATGLVVVGDLIGEGSAQEQSVVGETPNLAARLQALAEPDAVVIAASTRRLVGDLFEYRDLGTVEVKGITAPVPAWRVLGPSAVESRFEALRGSALSQLVGRDEEVDLLFAPLGARQGRRRPGRADLRRTRDRQVAPHRSIGGTPARRAAYPAALFLLALLPG
jgi:class 3 adenylate cyclase